MEWSWPDKRHWRPVRHLYEIRNLALASRQQAPEPGRWADR